MRRLFIMTGLPIILGTTVRALVIGATLLGLAELSITPVVYGLLNYLFIGILLLVMYRRNAATAR